MRVVFTRVQPPESWIFAKIGPYAQGRNSLSSGVFSLNLQFWVLKLGLRPASGWWDASRPVCGVSATTIDRLTKPMPELAQRTIQTAKSVQAGVSHALAKLGFGLLIAAVLSIAASRASAGVIVACDVPGITAAESPLLGQQPVDQSEHDPLVVPDKDTIHREMPSSSSNGAGTSGASTCGSAPAMLSPFCCLTLSDRSGRQIGERLLAIPAAPVFERLRPPRA
jgi:hypothetical protein